MKRYLARVVGVVALMTLSVTVSAQDARSAQVGKATYAARECARCHMIAGRGNKAGKLDGVGSKMSPAEMRRWLTAPTEMEAKLDHTPKVKMSSRKTMTLTDGEVDALVAYLTTLKK